MYEDMRSPCRCGYEGAAKKLLGLLPGRAEMLAECLDGLLVAGLEEVAHRERFVVRAVAIARCAQMGAAVGRRQCENRPGALPGFLERERSGRLLDASSHRQRRAVVDDHVLDRL